MLLVVAYSREARSSVRNCCRRHSETVVRRFGRAVLFKETAFAAFQALRLREKHGGDVAIHRTSPFNEYVAVPGDVREAVSAYLTEASRYTPYERFARGTRHPGPSELKERELPVNPTDAELQAQPNDPSVQGPEP